MRNTRELFTLLSAVIVGTARSLQDGKFGFNDIGNYINTFLAGEPAIDEIGEIPNELAVATADQKAEQVAEFRADITLDLGQEDAADVAAFAGGIQAGVSLVARRSKRQAEEAMRTKLAAMLNDGTLVYSEPISLNDGEFTANIVDTILETYELE